MAFNVELQTSVISVSLPNKSYLCCMLQCVTLLDNVFIVVMKSFTILLPPNTIRATKSAVIWLNIVCTGENRIAYIVSG
jgi:hypothetical protein